jgi:hypothetical protein
MQKDLTEILAQLKFGVINIEEANRQINTEFNKKVANNVVYIEEKKKYIETHKELFDNIHKDNNFKDNSKKIVDDLYALNLYSKNTSKSDVIGSMIRLYNKMFKHKKVLKKSNQSNEFIKHCPECGGDMIKTNPQRSEPSKTYPQGQILYYRRITCQTCNHYESHSYKKPRSIEREPYELTAIEIDQIESRKANKYYPRKTTGFAHQRRTNKNK